MMLSQAEATRFIAELTRETLAGRLSWVREAAPQSVQALSIGNVDYIYTTRVEQWLIGVFEATYKDYSDDTMESYTAIRPIVATFVSGVPKVAEYVFPRVDNAFHLLDAVQGQASNIRGLLDAWKNRSKPE